jgi:hypothetical protein
LGRRTRIVATLDPATDQRRSDLKPGADRMAAAVQAAFAHGAPQAGHPVEGGERLPTIRVVRVGASGQSSAA